MYIVVTKGSRTITYRAIKNLSFVPEIDVTGTKMPVNQYEVDVMTEDTIHTGWYAELYDDRDLLWARYWITYAEKVETSTVHVRAQSRVVLLERRTLPAVMYSSEGITNVLNTTLGGQKSEFALDSSFSGKTITGFFPEQTARDRLLWICFAIGAYVKDFGDGGITILQIDKTERTVPIDKTFWKTKLEYSDPVSSVRIKAYSYTQGEPQTTDKWVSDGTNTYIQTEQDFYMGNPNWDSTQAENVVSIDNVTIVNESNVDDILSHLSTYYFNRNYAEVDIINNRDYMPGELLSCYTDEENMITGYAESCNFKFGLQARSTVVLTAVEQKDLGKLVIIYMGTTHEGNVLKIGQRVFHFPTGYTYTITNPYIDLTVQRYKYVFRPVNETITGTTTGNDTRTEQCEAALVYHRDTKILQIISVDEVTIEEREATEGNYNVAVIK